MHHPYSNTGAIVQTHNGKIISYLEQLDQMASANGTTVLDACKHAGIATSVYYRARNGASLHIDNANRIADSIMAIGRKQERP